MPEVAANRSQISRWQPWHGLALLVAAHATFNLLLNPMGGGSDEFLTMLCMGVVFMQPIVFAMWTAIGPPPAMKRIPYTLAGFIIVVFATCVVAQLRLSSSNFPSNRIGLEFLIVPGALYAAAIIVALAVRIVTRWHIGNSRGNAGPATPVNQFSIRNLLVLTAVCAVLLGIGRWLAISSESFDASWVEIGRIVARIWLILFVMIPAILITLTVISFRPTLRMCLGTVFSGCVLAWVAIETIILLDNPPRREVTRQVLFIQLGAMLGGIASALMLRFAGYRLFRKSKAAPAGNHQA
jgi:hypothetical protein